MCGAWLVRCVGSGEVKVCVAYFAYVLGHSECAHALALEKWERQWMEDQLMCVFRWCESTRLCTGAK